MRIGDGLAALAMLGLLGCSGAPMGPTVMALPAQGKSPAQFQTDDASCRSYAEQMIAAPAPADTAKESTVNSAALGAGSGRILGSGTPQTPAETLQRRYDASYLQCMAARGESVPTAPSGLPPRPGYSQKMRPDRLS